MQRFAGLVVLAGALAARAQEPSAIIGAQRILFLGDSITWDGRYVAYVDAWLASRFPDQPRNVLNLGLPSETVSGLSEADHAGGKFPRPVLRERLARVLEATKPDLVIACYGINCAIYRPFDEERFKAFQDGMRDLHRAVLDSGAKIIHVTPPTFDKSRSTGAPADYNDAVLGRYGEWLLARRADGWEVIDLHGPMTAAMNEGQRNDAAFTLQPDGIHPDDHGHWVMARTIIAHFGDADAATAPTPEAMLSSCVAPRDALSKIGSRMTLLRDAWLTKTGHIRPEMPEGVPIDEAESAAKQLGTEIATALAPAKP